MGNIRIVSTSIRTRLNAGDNETKGNTVTRDTHILSVATDHTGRKPIHVHITAYSCPSSILTTPELLIPRK